MKRSNNWAGKKNHVTPCASIVCAVVRRVVRVLSAFPVFYCLCFRRILNYDLAVAMPVLNNLGVVSLKSNPLWPCLAMPNLKFDTKPSMYFTQSQKARTEALRQVGTLFVNVWTQGIIELSKRQRRPLSTTSNHGRSFGDDIKLLLMTSVCLTAKK